MQPFDPNAVTKKEDRARATPMHAGRLPGNAYCATRMVRFSDCDPTGVVYAPRFVEIVNGVVEDFFLAELHISYHEVIAAHKIGLRFASVDCDFFRPARMSEQLIYTPVITHIGRTSVILVVHCHYGAEEVMRCRLVAVTTSLDTHAAITMPADIRKALTLYRENSR